MTYAIAALLLFVGVALFVSAPLYGSSAEPASRGPDGQRERLEHERAQAVHGLRELEFDHQMNKLSRADYQQLRTRLEARALSAMAALERLNPRVEKQWTIAERHAPEAHPTDAHKASVSSPEQPREVSAGGREAAPDAILLLTDKDQPGAVSRTNALGRQPGAAEGPRSAVMQNGFCPACGARRYASAQFCSSCGVRVSTAR
jgi:hypothetical protein